jgi:predicted secreted protein
MAAGRLALAVAALAWLVAPAAVGQERTETPRSVRVGMPFEIALAANPSTGYGWRIDEKTSTGLERIAIEDRGTASPRADRPRQPIVGAPVTHTWLITPLQPGPVRLVLDYSRPWETGTPAKTHLS